MLIIEHYIVDRCIRCVLFCALIYCVCQYTKTKLLKIIWVEAALPLLVADPLIATMHNRLTVFASWHICACPSNTQFLGAPRLSSQMTAQSVQLLLHGRCRIPPIRTLCCAIPPQKKISLTLWESGPNPPPQLVSQYSGVTRLQWARVQVFQKGPLFPQKTF